eukprot:gene11367-23792_t
MGSTISTLVFQPPDVTYMHAKKHIIWLRTKADAKVPAFYIDRKASITMLFSHGNAEDLGMIYEWFCEFTRELQVNLLAYDYEGYGKASGTPSEQACYSDIEAAYLYLTETMGQASENIVLYGRSLGSGPSCYLAQRLRLEGKPLDVACPVLLVHGTRDEVVPFWNGEDLFLSASKKWRAKPFWVEGAGHNNIETLLRDDGSFFERIREFLEEWVTNYQSPAPMLLGVDRPSSSQTNAMRSAQVNAARRDMGI